MNLKLFNQIDAIRSPDSQEYLKTLQRELLSDGWVLDYQKQNSFIKHYVVNFLHSFKVGNTILESVLGSTYLPNLPRVKYPFFKSKAKTNILGFGLEIVRYNKKLYWCESLAPLSANENATVEDDNEASSFRLVRITPFDEPVKSLRKYLSELKDVSSQVESILDSELVLSDYTDNFKDSNKSPVVLVNRFIAQTFKNIISISIAANLGTDDIIIDSDDELFTLTNCSKYLTTWMFEDNANKYFDRIAGKDVNDYESVFAIVFLPLSQEGFLNTRINAFRHWYCTNKISLGNIAYDRLKDEDDES